MENLPVAAPPAVDRLFDVAYQEHRRLLALRHGVVQQRQEVLPLLDRGVLELVDHEALEAVADFFVDERRVVAADEFREDLLGFGEEQHVLLVAQLAHLGVEVGQQCETAVILAQQFRRVPQPEDLGEAVAPALETFGSDACLIHSFDRLFTNRLEMSF